MEFPIHCDTDKDHLSFERSGQNYVCLPPNNWPDIETREFEIRVKPGAKPGPDRKQLYNYNKERFSPKEGDKFGRLPSFFPFESGLRPDNSGPQRLPGCLGPKLQTPPGRSQNFSVGNFL